MGKQQAPGDEVLVVAAILGDLTAFDVLASRHRAAAVRTARAVVGEAYAEDVAQDALLIAFDALPSIADPARFAPWLLTITRHRALRFVRREQRHHDGRVDLDPHLAEQVGAEAPPEAPFETAAEGLRHALKALPPDYAEALRLRFFEGCAQQEMAARLGVPVSTVKWRVYRGKQLLRDHLERSRQAEQEVLTWNASKN